MTRRTTPTPVDAARLRLTLMRLSRRLRQAGGSGITPSQLSALATLDRCGAVSLRDLAAAEKVAPSTLTRVVAALEDQGLLERVSDPADRRVTLATITPAGRTLLAKSRDRGTELLRERIATLQPAEAGALAAALPVLEALLGDER